MVPGSGTNPFRIPDPGVKKEPYPGSGSGIIRVLSVGTSVPLPKAPKAYDYRCDFFFEQVREGGGRWNQGTSAHLM